MLDERIEHLDLDRAKNDVLPFVRDRQIVEAWTKDLFRAPIRRLRDVERMPRLQNIGFLVVISAVGADVAELLFRKNGVDDFAVVYCMVSQVKANNFMRVRIDSQMQLFSVGGNVPLDPMMQSAVADSEDLCNRR